MSIQKVDAIDRIHLQTVMHCRKNSSPIWIEDHGAHTSSLHAIIQQNPCFYQELPIYLHVLEQLTLIYGTFSATK